MAQIVRNKLYKTIEKSAWKTIFDSVKNINLVDDVKKFLNKFLTIDEQILILRRSAIINYINKGMTYRKIKEILGVSPCTISGVKDILLGLGYNKRDKKKKYSINHRTRKVAGRVFLHTSKIVYKRKYEIN